ncbi:MAG: hypothetical protein EP306_11710 [Burkholderiales bacterium]|nr:MAG: hypothetical protein EP306_11710 [Burkholderiales bacterium]
MARGTRSMAMGSLVSVIVLSGCALTTDRIELQYSAQPNVAVVAGASEVSVGVRVNDLRGDKSKVSSKKNAFGMEMAPIVAAEDVSVTVRRAIEQELQVRGFRLGADDAAMVAIVADVVRFYNDHKPGFFAGDAVAELNMAVTVRARTGEVRYARQLVAQGVEPNIQLMSGNNARLALNRALENGMRMLFEDRAFLSALVGVSPPVQ